MNRIIYFSFASALEAAVQQQETQQHEHESSEGSLAILSSKIISKANSGLTSSLIVILSSILKSPLIYYGNGIFSK